LNNLEEIRIKTAVSNNIVFGFLGRLNKAIGNDSDVGVIVKISDVKFSEKNQANSAIIRIVIGDKKYYCSRNMSQV
jgi:hypothetical protein